MYIDYFSRNKYNYLPIANEIKSKTETDQQEQNVDQLKQDRKEDFQEFFQDHKQTIKQQITILQYHDINKDNLIYKKYQSAFPTSKNPCYYFATLLHKIRDVDSQKLFLRQPENFEFIKCHEKNPKSMLQFDSKFESGNLFCAYKISLNVYDLFMQNDINTKGNTQWFYFCVYNAKKGQRVKFNIMNNIKSRSLFEKNMQPLVKDGNQK